MKRRTSLGRGALLLLWLGLALFSLTGTVQAACGPHNLSDSCSSNYGLSGDLSAVSGPTSSTFPTVDKSQLPPAGALFYEDYKMLEAEARNLLARNLTFREDISPYRGSLNFDELVRKFDVNSGFSASYDDPDPDIPQMTLQERIDLADAELRRARNIYAFLAVYAPEARLRNDNGTDSVPGANYKGELCARPEDPNPVDPQHSGQVLDPVLDWCNFGARLRQSTREAANIRTIFAQQFMVDALSLQFSSKLLGGETMVRQEVAKFEAARHQYDLAEVGLTEALELRVGSGCLVSDFFGQSEWSLLSRIAENRVIAQQHIGLRLSYLDISKPENVEQAKDKAEDAYRTASTEGYINLIGMAGMANKAPTASCAKGSRPDGALVAGLALNMLETQRRVSEMTAGRNVFGFDVSFTPARPYFQEGQTQGLWNEAMALAQEAQRVAGEVELSNRVFDQNQAQLLAAVKEIQTTLDIEVSNDLSCGRVAGDTDDAAFFACAYRQIEELNKCAEVVRSLPETNIFENCMARVENGAPVINAGSTANQTLLDLRAAYLEQSSILRRAENIDKRIQLSNDRNATVTTWLGVSGAAQTASEVSGATLDLIGALDSDNFAFQVAGAAAGSINIAAKALAGALSTAADVEIANAENKEQIENMLLDQTELLIDALVARQAFQSKQVEFDGVLGHMQDVLLQTQRQRSYLALSPGNDPSYRMTRDSKRLELADALTVAAKISYLAARRAEYEYAARLSAGNFRISDIYRARTPGDMIAFLNKLRLQTNSLAGGVASSSLQPADFKLSMAKQVLGLTDDVLSREGFTTPDAIAAERAKRFRAWVAQNTVLNTFEPPFDNKPVLRFSFPTSIVDGGVFSQVLQQSYDRIWLLKMAGVAEPKPSNTGFSVNLLTEQSGLSYQSISVTQDGLTHLRAQSGCVFDYELKSPAALLGLEWAQNQDASAVTASFNANINTGHPWTDNGYRTPAFLGRPVSGTNWQVLVKAGAPEKGMVDMDLQKLTDIELNFSTTYASRTPGNPATTECTRIDY